MSEAVIIEIIKVTGAVITSIVAPIMLWLMVRYGKKQEQIHKEFNGMKDQLVKQGEQIGETKGNKQGRIEEKAEQKIRDEEKVD